MAPNAPIVNAGLKYCNGLQVSLAGGNKLLSVAAGAARDSSNLNDLVLDAAASVNGANVGVVNGLDTGALGNSLFYAVYVIGSSRSVFTSANDLAGGVSPNPRGPTPIVPPANPYPVGALLSLSASAPVLPQGYDMYRRVGWVKTDGSANFLKAYQYGEGQVRSYWWDVPIAAPATPVAAAYANLSLAAGVPPVNAQAVLDVAFTPVTAADVLEFLPFGSASAGAGAVRVKQTTDAVQGISSVVVPSALNAGAASVRYKMPSGALVLKVAGFQDVL